MPASNKPKLLFVINPVSGGQDKAGWEAGIRQFFSGTDYDYEWYYTTGINDAISIRFWITEWKPDKVIAVGGDGTLKLVAEQLVGTNIPLGICPAGSANGMARDLGIPDRLEDCLDIVLHGRVRFIDVIRIGPSDICLHLSDIGLNAQLVKYFEENNLRGKMGYAREVFRVLMHHKLMHVRIQQGNEIIEREAFMVVLANARMYGTGVMINPGGSLYDGHFEVIVIRKLAVLELLKMIFRRRTFNPEKIEVFSAESITIRTRHKAYFQVDGEYRGKTRQVAAVIEKKAVALLLPATAEAPA